MKTRAVETGGEKEGKSDRGEKKSDRGKNKSGGEKRSNSGKKLEIGERTGKEPRREKPETRSKSASAQKRVYDRLLPSRKGVASADKPRSLAQGFRGEKPETFSRSASASDLAPVLAADWSRPSRKEIAATNKPRRFAPDPGAEMTLSARALGLYDVPVASSDRLEDLDNGLIRMPETSLPWERGDQRNVYIAGHYLGQSGTPSRLVFYNLNKLKTGDELVLKDGPGRPYKYRLSEKFEVGPEASWVMGQVRNRDMVTLQTCIPPDFGRRLVVRFDRV